MGVVIEIFVKYPGGPTVLELRPLIYVYVYKGVETQSRPLTL